MNSEKLSTRLATVAQLITHHSPKPIRLADIGSDHAYLPCFLALNQKIEFAIAGEVVDGPFQSAQKEVAQRALTNIISVRKGDGLAVVEPADNINAVSICGMGGPLIRDILVAKETLIADQTLLYLQPNVGSYALRTWLATHHYHIIDECVIEDYHRYYEIIVAKKMTNQPTSLTELEQRFGPINLQQPSHAFYQKWQQELKSLQKIYQEMTQTLPSTHERAIKMAQEIEQIKEVLPNEYHI